MVRYYLLCTHYRSPIEFTMERLEEASVAYHRLRSPSERANAWSLPVGGSIAGELGEQVAEADRLFHESMDDDFNTAKAIGHLFDLSRQVNKGLDEGLGSNAEAASRKLLDLGGVLGLFWKAPAQETWPAEVTQLVQEREEARKSKNWKRSDEIRDRLLELGAVIKDTPQGPKLTKK